MVPASLRERIDRLTTEVSRPVIAVAGPVAGGKTTLANALAEALDTEPLSTDDYFPDYAVVPRLQRDEPEHADLARLLSDLSSLKAGREALVPVWSFFENRRTSERPIAPGRAVLVEGLFALHPSLSSVVDLGILVDAPAAERRERFVRRSSIGERGFTPDEAATHFDEVAEPTFWRHEPAYRARADVSLVQDGAGGFGIPPSD